MWSSLRSCGCRTAPPIQHEDSLSVLNAKYITYGNNPTHHNIDSLPVMHDILIMTYILDASGEWKTWNTDKETIRNDVGQRAAITKQSPLGIRVTLASTVCFSSQTQHPCQCRWWFFQKCKELCLRISCFLELAQTEFHCPQPGRGGGRGKGGKGREGERGRVKMGEGEVREKKEGREKEGV